VRKQHAQELKLFRGQMNFIFIAEESSIRAEAEATKTVINLTQVESNILL